MFPPVLFPSCSTKYGTPPKNTTLTDLARGFGADDDCILVAAGEFADKSLVSLFKETCRALLFYLGIGASQSQVSIDIQKGTKHIANEVAHKKVSAHTQKIDLNSMSCIEELEDGKPFIYLENDYARVRINTSMTLVQFHQKAVAAKELTPHYPDTLYDEDLTIPWGLGQKSKYPPIGRSK